MSDDYAEFLKAKRAAVVPTGFETTDPVNPKLFPWQADIVRWALRIGKAAIFAECGLGKTGMQLEWARHVCGHTGGDALILAPLSVASQTRREGEKFGVPVTVCRNQADVRPGVNVTNYEMMKHFDPSAFKAVVVDESGILKSFMGATKQAIIRSFAATPYKLACTATPSPNDTMELGNHADFLDVLGSGEMLARWFINDTMEAGAYRLKGHAEKDFWRWVASWAVSLSKPSDLGYPDDGFVLPPLNMIPEVVEVDLRENADGLLFRMPLLSATSIHKEMRLTARGRAERAAEIVRSRDVPWVVWCNTNYEADELVKLLPSAVELRGDEPSHVKLRKLEDFADGKSRVFISKAKIAGWGLNWQHASDMVFVGLSYSYEAMYQSIRRSWRFGQRNPVNVHVVMAETEGPVLRSVEAKQREHEKMKVSMVEAMAESGLKAGVRGCGLSPVAEDVAEGDGWRIHLGDNCRTTKLDVGTDTVGLTVSSLPFANLYIYSDSEADMGNSADDAEFFAHMGYLIKELYRVTIPGRLCVMHCKDLPLYKGRDGAAGLKDFPGAIVRAFEDGGWTYHSRVTVWKDPVTEMQRTKNHGLLYKNLCQDSSCSRQGMADYLLVFRKWQAGVDKFPDPVHGSDPERFDRYVGTSAPDPNLVAMARRTANSILPQEDVDVPLLDGGSRVFITDKNGNWPKTNPFPRGSVGFRLWSIAVWQKYASPVWMDIDPMDVLQYREARDEQDERHICPLQLDVIERAVHLWSNPGDLVLDPFAGIGSTPLVALKCGRRALGIELKPSYFRQAVRNLTQAERGLGLASLFDGAGVASETVSA